MHIEMLKVFCDLAELRSFTKAASKHMLSQSAVSQQLAQLEVMHKCQLIDRKKRPLELTSAGEVFYKGSKELLERYEQMKSQLSELRSKTESRINVGTIFSIGMHALPDYLKRFMVLNPSVNVHVEYFSAEHIYEHVLSGELDIGLVAVPKRDKRLHVYNFQNETLVLVCNPRHPLANGEQILDVHCVQFERFIGFEQGVPTRTWIDSLLGHYGVTVRPVMEFDNVETLKRAVEINSGISILPENSILSEVTAGTLQAISLVEEDMVRPTGIIVRRDKILSKAAQQLIEILSPSSK